MAFKTGNSQLDYLMSRARRKNATKNADIHNVDIIYNANNNFSVNLGCTNI